MNVLRFRAIRRELVCREAVDLMTAYLDDALPRRDRSRLEAHLAECEHCGEYLRQLRITVDAIGYVTPEDLDPDVVDEFVDLYRRWQSS